MPLANISWNGSGTVLPRSWCTLPRQLRTQNIQENNLSEMAANKTSFSPKGKMMGTSKTSFLKTEWQQWKEPLYLSSAHSFPEIQRTLPAGAAVDHWVLCFCGVKLKKDARVSSSCFCWHFLYCQTINVPAKWPSTYTSWGISLPGAGKTGKPPLRKSHSIKPEGAVQRGPLCAGALYQSEGAHSFALTVGRISLTQLKSLS